MDVTVTQFNWWCSFFLKQFHASVVIRSNKTKVSLPFNANLGVIQTQTSADHDQFRDAADHTADQLASSWLKFADAMSNNNQFCSSFQQEQFIDNEFCFSSRQDGPSQTHGSHSHLGVPHHPSTKAWQLHAQTAEMARAWLDSSILSPFLPEPDLDHPNAMPSPESSYLDPNSVEYLQYIIGWGFGTRWSHVFSWGPQHHVWV